MFDLLELTVLLHAKVSYDVGMDIGFSEEFHLTICDAETSIQNPLDSYLPVVERASGNMGDHKISHITRLFLFVMCLMSKASCTILCLFY